MNPYHYDSSIQEVKLCLKKDTTRLLHYSVQFRSGLDTGYSENSLVKGEYYLPKIKNRAPLAILVHGMGDYSIIPCRLLARSLLKHGIACFIPYLSLHSKRIPEAIRSNLPNLTPDQWFQIYQVSVVDILQFLDFLLYLFG